MADEASIDKGKKGIDGFAEIMRAHDEGFLTLVCLSGLTDAWALFDTYKDLFKQKIGRVVIMGGVETEDGNSVKRDEKGLMIPDKARLEDAHRHFKVIDLNEF